VPHCLNMFSIQLPFREQKSDEQYPTEQGGDLGAVHCSNQASVTPGLHRR
jgi:hypothetical protein